MKISFLLTSVTVISLFCNYGCVEENTAVNSVSSFNLIQTKIFNTSCALSGCHSSEKDSSFPEHRLLLTEGVAYDNLVNKDPNNEHALHDELKIVKPGDSEKSLLMHKLHCHESHHQNDYGNVMPLGREPLSKGQIDFITAWINEGAPKNEVINADPQLLEDNVPSCNEDFTALAAPTLGMGYQVKVDPFDINPDFEREIFVYKELGNEDAFYLNRIEMKMRRNSHHFLVNTFQDYTPAPILPSVNTIRDLRDANNNYIDATMKQMEYQIFTIASQTPEMNYNFPQGVALKIPAHQKLDINLHYVNKSSSTIQGECYLNLYKAETSEVVHEALPLYISTEDIMLPAREKTVIIKKFSSTRPMKIFMLTSHTHKHGESFEIQINGGNRNGEVIYSSLDWHHPVIKTYETPINLNAGEGLTMIITYNNTTDKVIRFGLTSEDEMGIIFGYYY
jgi:hypothetical protein